MAQRVDKEQISRDWEERGYSCDLWTDSPGQIWEDYVHEVDELVLLVDGKIELEIEGKTIQPELGQEIFIPADTLHTVRNIGGIMAHWLYGYRKYQI